MTNPPNQYFEEVLGIPKCKLTTQISKKFHLSFSAFNWKRCAFRTTIVFLLLFIAECLPNFGSLLDLIGGSTVTLLTFVFPPFFYMRLVDVSSEKQEWQTRSYILYIYFNNWVYSEQSTSLNVFTAGLSSSLELSGAVVPLIMLSGILWKMILLCPAFWRSQFKSCKSRHLY